MVPLTLLPGPPRDAAMRNPQASGLGLLRAIEDAAGQCRQPVRLRGRLTECDPATGEVTRMIEDAEVPCGNRREQVCPPCSRLYKGDTFQVMIAGMAGGHGIPETVAAHPAVFVTLTAPGFGLVHRGPGRDGQPVACRPRRARPVCEHGQPASCGRRHAEGEAAIGQPLCMECFDYAGAVLFNACVPALWDQQVQAVRRQLAADTGLSQQALRRHARVSFGRVAEYQERGLVHVHAVFRLDGPDGPGDPAPPWADAELLRQAVLTAVTIPAVTLPHPDGDGMLTLSWGAQVDTRIVRRELGGELDGRAVAAYVAKYATKGTEAIGGIPVPIRSPADLDDWNVTGHVRRLITACWQLGQRQEYQGLRLARWAHQLGYGGHFSTRSRRYSVTLTSRRQERRAARAAWAREQAGLPADPGVITAEWHYAGQARR
jgi:hypothetical protein